jgi:hypothetical protein
MPIHIVRLGSPRKPDEGQMKQSAASQMLDLLAALPHHTSNAL